MALDKSNGSVYAIVKGFIDARDPRSQSVYGAFVVVTSIRATHFIGQMFSDEPIDKEMRLDDLMHLLSSGAAMPSDPILERYRTLLNDHIRIHRTFEIGRAELEEKSLERKISSFCSSALGINAVTFIEVQKVDEQELLSLMPHILDAHDEDDAESEDDLEDGAEAEGDDEDAEGADDKKPDEMYLSCGPVLDAVAGIAAGDLINGDKIDVTLPDGSMYGKIMSNMDPNFNGIVSAEVLGVKIDEYGAAVVALKIADGVSGALRISESVKLRRSSNASFVASDTSRSQDVIIAILGIALMLIVTAVLIYLF